MRTKFALVLLLAGLAYVVFRGSFAFSGSSVGNGTDDFVEGTGSAWFIGQNKTVHACVQRAADFAFSQEQLTAKIQSAVSRWRDYYAQKHVDQLIGEAWRVSFQVQVEPTCTPQTDLTFYFGVQSSEVQSSLGFYDRPFAFAQKTMFDPNVGWGRGFVWFRGQIDSDEGVDWRSGYAFDAVLIHELGHVFGCEHVNGTIMDPRLAKILRDRQNDATIVQVDQTEELVLCDNCRFSYASNGGALDDRLTMFKYFVGRDPVGTVRTRIAREIDSIGPITLYVGDDQKEYPFELTMLAMISDYIGPRVFSATLGTNEAMFHTGQMNLYTTPALTGHPANVYVGRNMNAMSVYVNFLNEEAHRMMNIIQMQWTSY